jgi:gamma-polyglutamate synthase
MHVSYFLLFLLICAVVYGVSEFVRHQRRAFSIPIRVHVNGTRGKSSVTRLIGAGLRAGGISTITKVTGTYPRLILDDGSDVHIHRRGPANIIEQLDVIRFAAKRNVKAIVVECMALQRQYQTITEHQMVHANVGVMTNIRLDHIDIMGRTLQEIAEVLAETIPPHQHLFTAENAIPDVIQSLAEKKHAVMHQSSESTVAQDEMKGFRYIEHRENVALALDVCAHLGVQRSVALEGMYRAVPDAGVLRRWQVHDREKHVEFYNAFAANDPDSTLVVWNRVKNGIGFVGMKVILLNTRQDRMDRAQQLAEMVGRKLRQEVDYLMLIGQSSDVVAGMAMHNGVPARQILNVGWTTPERVYDEVLAVTQTATTVVGIGNMGGMGAEVAEYFEQRSTATYDRVRDYARVGSESALV